jgi:hypothetical protein
MIAIAFFFLLWPGEYTISTADSTPFTLQDVQFQIGEQRVTWQTAATQQLWSATFVTLGFRTQKNAVRGEAIGLGRSGNPSFCPILALAQRVIHLQDHGGTATSPLASYFDGQRLQSIKPADITNVMQIAATALSIAYGFTAKDISA